MQITIDIISTAVYIIMCFILVGLTSVYNRKYKILIGKIFMLETDFHNYKVQQEIIVNNLKNKIEKDV